LVGKKDCAAVLGWHRQVLDRRLERDKLFPRHVDENGRVLFDLAKVHAHLEGSGAPKAPKAPVIDQAQLRDAVKPPQPREPREAVKTAAPRGARHSGEATARQRKDEAEAEWKELRVKTEKGKVLPAERVYQAAAVLVASLGTDLDTIPGELIKRAGLPQELEPVIRVIIDDIRRAMVKRAEPLLDHA
jgi:hypothetical protein